MKKHEKLILFTLFSSATLTVMAGALLAPTLNLIRDALNITPASVGLIITTHGLCMAVFSPLVGFLIDRKGPKWFYVYGLIFYGLAGGAGALINTFWILIVNRVILGMGMASMFTAITLYILSLYQGSERNNIMGWRGSAQHLGGIIWPMIGGALGVFSWHFPFLLYLSAVPLGFLAMISMPDIKPALTDTGVSGAGPSTVQVFKDRPKLFAVYGLMFTANILLYVMVIYVPQLLDTFGVQNTFEIGLVLASMTLSAAFFSFNYGKIRKRFSYGQLLSAAMVMWSSGFIVIFWSASPFPVWVGVFLFGAGQGIVLPAVTVWIGELVPVAFLGRFSSYLGTFGFMGQFLSPIVFAPVFKTGGMTEVFAAAACVGVFWFLLLKKALKK